MLFRSSGVCLVGEKFYNSGVEVAHCRCSCCGLEVVFLTEFESRQVDNEENQNDAAALLNKSAVLLALGKNDEAITFYDRAVSLDKSLRKTMERPKSKMRLWKKILRRLAIGFGFLVTFHLIIQLIRYLM